MYVPISGAGMNSISTSLIVSLLFVAASYSQPHPIASSLSSSSHLVYGFPGSNGKILDKKYYLISYLPHSKIPEWTAYKLKKADLAGKHERTNDFRPDGQLDEDEQSQLKDYKNSGFARGHSAPAEDFSRSLSAMSSTFVLSNMSPQHGRLNSGKWRVLEKDARLVAQVYDSCWIITGGILSATGLKRGNLGRLKDGSQRAIGINAVAVPTRFYKIIAAMDSDGSLLVWAFMIEHRNKTLPGKVVDYAVSIDSIESLSGLDFFPDLDEEVESRIERTANRLWPVKK
jgi:endonuclease G